MIETTEAITLFIISIYYPSPLPLSEFSLDLLHNTFVFCHIDLIVDPLHDEECEGRCCDDTEYDSESHPCPESVTQCDREDTECCRDRREGHRLQTRGSCFDESVDTAHSFLEILIDGVDEDYTVVDGDTSERYESDTERHRELVTCREESEHHEWE